MESESVEKWKSHAKAAWFSTFPQTLLIFYFSLTGDFSCDALIVKWLYMGKSIRCNIFECRMHTNTVIVCLNVHENRLPDIGSRMFSVERFQLVFEGFEERFGACVVPAITLSAHALSNRRALPAQNRAKRTGAILHAAVGVEYQAVLRGAVTNRHFQGSDGGVGCLKARAQPGTFRSNRSSTTVRYTQPLCVRR